MCPYSATLRNTSLSYFYHGYTQKKEPLLNMAIFLFILKEKSSVVTSTKNQKLSNLLVILDSLTSNRSITHANNVNRIRALKFRLDSSLPEVTSYLFRSAILIKEAQYTFSKLASLHRSHHTINRAAFVCLSVCLFPISSEVL